MRIIVCSITFNNADIIRLFLRHYETFADEIAIWDDYSNDGTREILKSHSKVNLRDWPYPGSGIDEDLFLKFIGEIYPTAAKHGFDWLMWPDSDEIIYSPNVRETLRMAQASGIEVIKPDGYNMMGDGLPIDDGKSQIYELNPMGVRAPVYSKPVVFQPHIRINWIRGKHDLENCNPVVGRETGMKLLHYRYLGHDYTAKKNAKNFARCGLLSGDKGAAWTCDPRYTGEHSAPWAEAAKKLAFNVLEV